jgi:hypothetical protein
VVSNGSVDMTVTNFESLGGIKGGLFGYRDGTLVVASGVATFQVI